MSGFQVGDVVVRLATDHIPLGTVYSGKRLTVAGKFYRVASVNPFGHDQTITLVGISNSRNAVGFSSSNFRKIDRADEQFTAQIRACKPHRVGEPV